MYLKDMVADTQEDFQIIADSSFSRILPPKQSQQPQVRSWQRHHILHMVLVSLIFFHNVFLMI